MAGSPIISTDASYQTLLTLASGGMGRVDLAIRHEGTFERLFAVKRPLAELASDAEVRAMFLDETRIAGLIRHPNVVSIVDVGEDGEGPFAVMEFVEGISVADLLKRTDLGPLPLEIPLRIAQQVAEGLHAAHELVGPDGKRLELVHRDVSPQNILVGFDGIARVTDFGVAKALGRTSKTMTGILKGKLGYISPEQLRFEEPDRRADLFALGIVLFELLSGERLYRSVEGNDGPRRILNEPPPDLADYRDDPIPELVELLFELLAKDREGRPADAKTVARKLESILAVVTATSVTVETADFLQRHFHDERQAFQRRIQGAREGLVDRPKARKQPKRFSRWQLAAMALFAVAALGGIGWAALDASSRRVDESAVATEPAKAPAISTDDVTIKEPAEKVGEPPSPSATAVATVAKPRTQIRSKPAARTKPSKPSTRPSKSKDKSSMPIWEEY